MATNAGSFSRRTWAVAIGVSSFVAGELEALASPAPDARRRAAALSNEVGCDVPAAQVRCLPAEGAAVTRGEVPAAVRQAVSDVPAEGILILYFAGQRAGTSAAAGRRARRHDRRARPPRRPYLLRRGDPASIAGSSC